MGYAWNVWYVCKVWYGYVWIGLALYGMSCNPMYVLWIYNPDSGTLMVASSISVSRSSAASAVSLGGAAIFLFPDPGLKSQDITRRR